MSSRDAHQAKRRHASQGRERSRAPDGARSYGAQIPVAHGAPPPAARFGNPSRLALLRYGLPALIVGAGVVAMCIGTPTSLIGGAGLLGAGLATALVSWFYRIGVAGDTARDDEDLARRYFDRYGRWPDGRV
jgi:hypothetical protein